MSSDQEAVAQSTMRYNDQVANQLIAQMQDHQLQRMQHWRSVNEQASAFAAANFTCPHCGKQCSH